MSLEKILVSFILTVSLATTYSVLANIIPTSGVSSGAAASSSVGGDGATIIKTENTVSTTNPSTIEAGIMQVFSTQAPALPKVNEPEVALNSAPPTAASIPASTTTTASPLRSTVTPATPTPAATSLPSTPALNNTLSTVTNSSEAAAAKKEEVALINEVVSKVLESDAASIERNTNINVFDASGKQLDNVVPSKTTTNANATLIPSVKGLMNDPNTVLVLIDDSKSNSTSQPPVTVPALATTTTTTTPQPLYNKTSTAALVNSIINDPKNDNKNISVIVEVFKTPAVNATKPVVIVATTVTPTKSSNSTKPTENTLSPIAKSTTSSTTVKSSIKTTTKPSTSAAPSTTSIPRESLADLLKRHEREKKELEMKLKGESGTKQRKQNEKDAQMAIKTLQAARSHSTDNKLHQLEHNRQMALDPIGHTLKHQQYELSKQRLLSGV